MDPFSSLNRQISYRRLNLRVQSSAAPSGRVFLVSAGGRRNRELRPPENTILLPCRDPIAAPITTLVVVIPFLLMLLGIDEAMQVRHEITHLGVIHRRLRLGPPGGDGRGMVRKQTDDVDLIEIFKLYVIQIFEFAAENKMEELFLWRSGGLFHDIIQRLGQKGASSS
jgi:hypothetical protein